MYPLASGEQEGDGDGDILGVILGEAEADGERDGDGDGEREEDGKQFVRTAHCGTTGQIPVVNCPQLLVQVDGGTTIGHD